MTYTLCHPSTWMVVPQLHRELETSLGYIRKEDWECSSAIQDLSNMHEGFNSACILSPSPSALPLFLSLCPLPHTQSQVWTDRCTQLECSGRASRRACHLGKVDEIKDKWPSDKKVESGQNVSQRGIPNSSPIVHP